MVLRELLHFRSFQGLGAKMAETERKSLENEVAEILVWNMVSLRAEERSWRMKHTNGSRTKWNSRGTQALKALRDNHQEYLSDSKGG